MFGKIIAEEEYVENEKLLKRKKKALSTVKYSYLIKCKNSCSNNGICIDYNCYCQQG